MVRTLTRPSTRSRLLRSKEKPLSISFLGPSRHYYTAPKEVLKSHSWKWDPLKIFVFKIEREILHPKSLGTFQKRAGRKKKGNETWPGLLYPPETAFAAGQGCSQITQCKRSPPTFTTISYSKFHYKVFLIAILTPQKHSHDNTLCKCLTVSWNFLAFYGNYAF